MPAGGALMVGAATLGLGGAEGAGAGGGLDACGADEDGSGTGPAAALGLATVKGVWHLGHLMESPAAGMRLSSSS